MTKAERDRLRAAAALVDSRGDFCAPVLPLLDALDERDRVLRELTACVGSISATSFRDPNRVSSAYAAARKLLEE